MKLDTNFARIAAAALLAFALSSCAKSEKTTAEDVKKETTEAAETAGQYIKEQNQAFQMKMEQRLVEIDRQITELQAKADKQGSKAKAETKQQLEELNEERRDLGQKLSDMTDKAAHATREGWEEMKQAVEQAADKLEAKLKR